MKFANIENIWTVEVSCLSNSDRGRVYFERAKQVVNQAFADQVEFERATRGRRFRRMYLVDRVGCKRAATLQNPRIKQLLVEADEKVCLVLAYV